MSLDQHSPGQLRRPRFGRMPSAIEYSGLSRSRLYELAAVTNGLFRKQGRSTLIDFAVLDQLLEALPAAELKSARPAD
jgi:hypothetical protein